jgi:hypothetical protein
MEHEPTQQGVNHQKLKVQWGRRCVKPTPFQLRKAMTDKGTISSGNQSSEIVKFNREFLFFNGKRTGESLL